LNNYSWFKKSPL